MIRTELFKYVSCPSKTLHFLLSQRIQVKKDSNICKSSIVWIDSLESLKPSSDFVKIFGKGSPLLDVAQRSKCLIPTKVDIQDCSRKLFYGGRISVFQDGSSTDSHDMMLRFCILEEEEKSVEIGAIVHQPNLELESVSRILGAVRFTESNLPGLFHGITGLSWIPELVGEDQLTSTSVEDTTSETVVSTNSTAPEPAHTDPTTLDADSLRQGGPEELLQPKDDSGVPGLPVDSGIPDLEALPEDTIRFIAELTKGQANSTDEEVWRMLRKKRLTASLFGVVISAIERGRYTKSLFKTLLRKYDVSNVAAIRWGNDNEENAKKAYEEITGVKVQSTGLWLHTSGILGASPDGLLPDGQGLVEFKCPYSSRECTITETIANNGRFYLKKDEEGTIHLDKKHAYYHQIQGMLHIIGREYCDFCVWSPVGDPVITRIDRDPSWEGHLSELISFYFEQFLPRVLGGEERPGRETLLKGYRDVIGTIDQVLVDQALKRTDRKERRARTEPAKEGELCLSELPRLSPAYVAQLAAFTSTPLGATESKAWWALREHRLTSSSFHQVLRSVGRNRYPDSLFKSIMDEYFALNTATSRTAHAGILPALRAYEVDRGVDLMPGGLWLDETGLLGASLRALHPDGMTIVDVRCLVKWGGVGDVKELLEVKGFHLGRTEEGGVEVRRDHRVWDKVQGSLHLSGRCYCDVITYSPSLYHVTRVQRDERWAEDNLEVLRSFYLEQLFPVLCRKWGYDHVIRDLQRLGAEE